ncbi:MAG: type III-A CRISPR-associated RAMP protein Csm3 [Sulfuricurvum sp.]
MRILTLQGEIKLLSGLHIGGGDDTMKIGGIDNQVIKDINTGKPYIPGSSLKGKMRSLLEWDIGVVNLNRNKKNIKNEDENKENGKPLGSHHIFDEDGSFLDVAFQDESKLERAKNLIKIFGDSNSKSNGTYGITRISVSDCELIDEGMITSEAKYENVIDRKTGTAKHPRQSERVPAGVKFTYTIKLKVLDQDDETTLRAMIKKGLELIENDYLGGSGSRGYGRVTFSNKINWTE